MKASTASQAGVSLLEILVVMAIASLASTIVFQGFSQITIIDRQFSAQNDFMRDQAMTRSWWRSSVESIQPDRIDGNSKFKGDSKKFSGLSTSALGNLYGTPQPIHWALEFFSERGTINLISRIGTTTSIVQSWPGNNGEFFYYDNDGQRYANWPPESGMPPQIPAMIEMRITHGGRQEVLFATPMGPRHPPQIYQNVLPGAG